MVNNGRKTIGAFITNVDSEFQSLICKGIVSKAKELDYNVMIFSSFGIFGKRSDYRRGEFNIIHLPDYGRLDGIILTPTTYSVKEFDVELRAKLKSYSKAPIVTILGEEDENFNILVNNDTILDDIMYHLIKVHKFTRINFLSGPKGTIDADQRLESYKRILSENKIPIEEGRIYYGDFWKIAAYDAVEKFFTSKLERPQAIVCANDDMAMEVCNALIKKGIRVPEDIVVTGCDDILGVSEYSPSLTTAKIPFYKMGRNAIAMLDNYFNNIQQPKVKYEKIETIYRESCGCKRDSYQETANYRRKLALEIDCLKMAIRSNADMSAELTGLFTIEEVCDKVSFYMSVNRGYNSMYLCLREDWQKEYDVDKNLPRDFQNMVMHLGIKNKIKVNKEIFPKEDLLPNIAIEDEAQVFYISLLHHLNNYFGYIIMNYGSNIAHSNSFEPWLINISNALENIRVNEELNTALFKLEDLYIKDPMTGLLNRRGFTILGETYLRQSMKDRLNIMVFTVDMDNLKLINDRYGHIQGDIAIKAIANALMKAADDDELCIRSGGDEFIVIGIEYTEEKLCCFIDNYLRELNEFNSTGEHMFDISTSYGHVLVEPNETTNLHEMLNIADKRMYQQKNQKRAMKII